MDNKDLIQYILGVSDNAMILGQRLGELCGHGPNLETDIALTNISLDLFGQTRSYLQYAAKLQGGDTTEDDLAYLRKEHEYKNVLLVEQPNTDFAYVIGRQFLFDMYHLLFLQELSNSKDAQLRAIAAKSIKEVKYHVRFSGDWVKRLGDGTQESHDRMQAAIDALWVYTAELFKASATEEFAAQNGIGVALDKIKPEYHARVTELLSEATLTIPENPYFLSGGKQGVHSEHMGFLLSDFQYMQRTYPNMTW
ncbi:MAG: 1,2-phenylacetyl-CoA epoxidase subunit PaaC [Gilvibacter sp.]